MIRNLLSLRGSVSHLYRPFSTGKAVMDAGKRAAARYAVDTFVKVSWSLSEAFKKCQYAAVWYSVNLAY